MANILVVDDDLDIVDSLKMILEANGHQVSVKTDTDTINDTCRVSRAANRIFDGYGPQALHRGTGLITGVRWILELLVANGGNFAGDPDNRKTIGTIGCNGNIQNRIAVQQRFFIIKM